MKALKILLYVVLGLLALWALLGLFARKNYHIERSTEIDAPIELVHEQVSFFKNFKHWSPWHVYDPNMQTNIEGTDGTPGAVYTWSGNDKVGKGNQVLRVVTPTRVELDVSYNDWGPSPVFFQLEPKGQKTNITWAMDMHVPFPWNAFAMLTDVNAFVGKDYESGRAPSLLAKKLQEKIFCLLADAQQQVPFTYTFLFNDGFTCIGNRTG